MRVVATATAVIFLTALTAAAQTGRGAVTSLSTEPGVGTGMVRFIVRGQNPCGAVHLQFGDGTDNVTYPIRELPWSVEREYHQTGDFRVRALGMGNCDGEAVSTARVTSVRPQPVAPPAAAPPAAPQAGGRRDAPQNPQNMRFAEMDRNRDGVITRQEWRGSQQSFDVHDWNRDGRLSGDEVRVGASWPNRNQGQAQGQQSTAFWDWSEAQFRQLDRNGDSRISRIEWARYDIEDFIRADQNGDNVLTLREFMLGDVDDDRGDRFAYLDLDHNNRIDRDEWHGSQATFRWLDRNADGQLSRTEVAGQDIDAGTGTGTGAGSRPGGVREPARTVVVNARQTWIDTGIELRAGDYVNVTSTGRVSWAPNAPYTDPNGDRSAGANYPLPGAGEGALIGRIGNTGTFLVGANLEGHRANATGRLYLMVNDDMVTDNRGNFTATVIVERRR